ncbi:MAG: hypothetical protein KDK39_02935 [Leptospiraceae bacterium]|nr:hypothetical protein [Leptospiraceae bacterium]
MKPLLTFMLWIGSVTLAAAPRIDAVYLAQTHVQTPDSPWFKLVSGREVLIKVNVIDPQAGPAVPVVALIKNARYEHRLVLSGPDLFPRTVDAHEHRFDNSWTAVIPAALVEPGLEMRINLGSQSRLLKPAVGAGHIARLRFLGFEVFGVKDKIERPSRQLLRELEAKLPVRGLEFIDSGDFELPEVAILAYKNERPRIARVDTPDNWHSMTFSMRTLRAMAYANGEYHTTIYIGGMSVAGGGWGGGNNFAGIMHPGVFWHELGHAYSLIHNNENKQYPYRGDNRSQYDIHAGPTWAYDPFRKYFIPATIQKNAVGNREHIGRFKRDPQWGGGAGDQEEGFLLRHYSDYNTHLMREYMEKQLDQKGTDGRYYQWRNGGWQPSTRPAYEFPVRENVPVYTLFGSASQIKDANYIYEPLAYTGNLITTYDPVNGMKELRQSGFCRPCNLTAKVTQGSHTRHYGLWSDYNTKEKPTSFFELRYWALNVPQSDGPVKRIEIFHTPDLARNGLPANPRLLSLWYPGMRDYNKIKRPQFGGRVWFDSNGNGRQDPGEKGIAGVKLIMWGDSNGDGKPDYQSFHGSRTTDAAGRYQWFNLQPGVYQIFVWEVDNFKPGGPLYKLQNSPGQGLAEDLNTTDDNGGPGHKLGTPYGSVATRPFRVGRSGILNTSIDFGFMR